MTGFINPDGSALVGGLLPTGVGQAIQLDSQGNVSIQTWLASMLMQGKGYTASNGLLNVAAGNYPLCIFNPANSGRNILLYSLHVSSGTAGPSAISVFLQSVTTNPAYGSTAVLTNAKGGGASSAIAASCTFATTSQTLAAPYSQIEFSNAPVELLINGSMILLPGGSATGVVLFFQTYASGLSSACAKWLEF